MDEWQDDSQINSANIEVEALGVSKLHSKYLKLITEEKIKLNKYIQDRDTLEDQLMQYFTGALDGKDIGRPPFQLNLTNARAQKAVKADKEFLKLDLQVSNQEEKILFLKEVVAQINQRSFHIKNFIEWKKWTAGSG